MAVDTKELIAEAVKRLLMQKKVKKLTVKDIVDECSITRQTFYYHFEDIPDLLKWVLERGTDKMAACRLRAGKLRRPVGAALPVPAGTERPPLCGARPSNQLPG